MFIEVIIWDLDDDLDGNVQHIEEHGVTLEEVEEILLNPRSVRSTSRSSGDPILFGYTSTGKHLAVVYEHVDDNPVTVRPVTAYELED